MHTLPPPPNDATELGFQDFVNLQLLATTLVKNKNYYLSNEKLNWLKVKSFEFRKDSPFIVGYKYDYFDEYKYIDVRSTKGSRRSGGNISMDDIVLKQLYTKALPISVEKKKDLINLCNKNVIPSIYHNFFFNLPSLSNKRADNIIAEADTDDKDENE
ncbi:unnamed protein product [Macrosiphum euphorbiae]|uniref:Uncharacterized protein n=1 Tax=Macrosiphum euphorbiae TaxID=13131 RepID=A0AAV0WI23_9HEMI|nr:unnamed protein product [Macrosiphum euphorbiae]